MQLKKNKKIAIIGPLVLALSIIVGIFVGMNFNKKAVDNRFIIYPRVDKLNSILNYVEEDYVDTVDKEELIEMTIPKMLKELDPHSIYIPAQELKRVNEPLQGNFSGIGVQFNMQNDTVAIIRTIANGPSEKVGILAGDRIVEVNDEVVAGVGMSSDSIVSRLKGPKGTMVEVGVLRKGVDELIDFEITRDDIPLYSVDVTYMIDDSLGYLKISKFSKTTFDEFMEGVNDLKSKGMKDLIIDLRDNSGGYMDAATNIADQFLNNGELIVYTRGKARPRTNVYATPGGACNDIDVSVLINEYSASASEILAGAIQDNDRGTIIGRRSFGKGLVQEQRVFKDGSAIRLTIARYYTPTGRSIQKPYENGSDEYYKDIMIRYHNGEFSSRDSIHFQDTIKFVTKGGKVVYGGGGIMPDIFVPLDTTLVSGYYEKIRNKGLIFRFAFDYVDKHRDVLKEKDSFGNLKAYLDNKKILNDFVSYASKKGVKPNWPEIREAEKYISVQLKAYIARNVLDNKGFFPIIQEIDQTLQKGIEVMANNQQD
jgi:carboxyl-terminal processing protease